MQRINEILDTKIIEHHKQQKKRSWSFKHRKRLFAQSSIAIQRKRGGCLNSENFRYRTLEEIARKRAHNRTPSNYSI